MDKRSWERLKRLLPVGYNWRVQYANRRNRKGTAMGGIVVGTIVGIEREGNEEENKEEEPVEVGVRLGKE